MHTVLGPLVIWGTPAPKGSKNQFGGESSKKVKPWMDSVKQAVGEALPEGWGVLRGPVKITATFVFVRPKSHYRTGKNAGVLRDDAPLFHTNPGDTDKLQRAIGDALSGVVYADDKQIAWWDVNKIWGERASATLTFIDLSGGSNDGRRHHDLEGGSDSGPRDSAAHGGVS